MISTRRQFFGVLGAIGAVSGVRVSAAGSNGLVSIAPNPEVKARGDAFLRAAHALFADAWQKRGHRMPGTIGAWRDANLQQHYGFTATNSITALQPNWTFAPGMECLAISSSEYGVQSWHTLPLPESTLYAGALGPIRLVAVEDVIFDRVLTRFDVLGHATQPYQESTRRRYSTTGQAFSPCGPYSFSSENQWA